MLCFTSVNLSAQKLVSGSLASLAGESSVLCEIDFSEGVYDSEKFDLNELIADVGDDWEKDSKEVLAKFRRSSNDKLESIGLILVRTATDKTNYKMVVVPQKVDDDGEVYLKILFYKIGEDKEVAEVSLNANGGTFGSFMNLFGDGMTNAGSKFGKWMKKMLK